MSKQPLGKTLLRNVIRHTDAHNKIQEEMEMWKMRDWQVQTSRHKHLPNTDNVRGRMHCDRDQPRDLSLSRDRVSEHDDREARYWTRKLYEFESNDRDRWGHSGFKELYPEEFESDSEKHSGTKKIGRHKLKKSKSDTEASLSKRSKKSSRKKKKKKKKKVEEEKRKRAESSSSSSSSNDSSNDSSATREKQRRKRTKSRHKNKKTAKTRGRDEGSSSEDSDEEYERERRTHSCKKRKQDSHRDSDSGPNSNKKRRKNWKAACDESSRDTSGD